MWYKLHMLFASCRKKRLSNFDFTSRHENILFEIPDARIRELNVENDANDEALSKEAQDAAPVTQRELAGRVKDLHVLVLVHGYRNPFANCARAYVTLADGLAAAGLIGGSNYGLVVGYLWPGRRIRPAFPIAVASANKTAQDYLPDLLTAIAKKAKSIDIETHSLGARVGLGAIRTDGERYLGKIDNVLLSAAAVDDESLERSKEFFDSTKTAQRIFNYHSKNDKVVGLAYRLGDFPEFDKALGSKGTEHPDRLALHSPAVFMVDCQDRIDSHGGYRFEPKYFEHWAGVVKENVEYPQFGKLG
jgi:esterase/lipase superfamily enzyme